MDCFFTKQIFTDNTTTTTTTTPSTTTTPCQAVEIIDNMYLIARSNITADKEGLSDAEAYAIR